MRSIKQSVALCACRAPKAEVEIDPARQRRPESPLWRVVPAEDERHARLRRAAKPGFAGAKRQLTLPHSKMPAA